MTSPSNYPFKGEKELDKYPYTDGEIGLWNTDKLREVYCDNCKYRTITGLPGPKCGKCNNSLYVVMRRALTRDELNELGRIYSSST